MSKNAILAKSSRCQWVKMPERCIAVLCDSVNGPDNNSYLHLYSQWQVSQKGKAGSSLLELAHYVLLAKNP